MKKRLLSLAACAIFMTGCATGSSAYGPQSGSAFGFKDMRIEDDRFRVSYTARTDDEARDFALLRAAQVTKEAGFDWFRIIGGSMDGDPNARRRIATNVGIGVANGGYRSRTYTNIGVGVGDIVGAIEGPKMTSDIEIKVGRGAAPSGQDVYNADEILKYIRPQNFK